MYFIAVLSMWDAHLAAGSASKAEHLPTIRLGAKSLLRITFGGTSK
jgi:hypothetical protein